MANVNRQVCPLCQKRNGEFKSNFGRICGECASRVAQAKTNIAPDDAKMYVAPPGNLKVWAVVEPPANGQPKTFVTLSSVIYTFMRKEDAIATLDIIRMYALLGQMAVTGREEVREEWAKEVFEWAQASRVGFRVVMKGTPLRKPAGLE